MGRSLENLLLEYFEGAMRAPSSALLLMVNPFVHRAGQLMFTWSFAGVALEALSSHDKLKLGKKESSGASNAGGTYWSRQLGIKPSEKKRCHLFLEVDYVSDN